MELSDGNQKRTASRKVQSPNSKNQTNSKFEIQNSKLDRVRWKDAQVMLTLHENHRKYYSSKKRSYAPFIIPASHNTRAGIKDWFRDRYGLELSVRPPHDRRIIGGMPTIFINAQVLLGKPGFPVFGPDRVGR